MRLHRMGLLSNELTEKLFHFFCICLQEPVYATTQTSEEAYPSHDEIGNSIIKYQQNKQLDSYSILHCAVFNLPCFYKQIGHLMATKKLPGMINLSRIKSTDQPSANYIDQATINGTQKVKQKIGAESSARIPRQMSGEDSSSLRSDLSMQSSRNSKKISSQLPSSLVLLYGKEIEKMSIQLILKGRGLGVRRTIAASFHELLANKKDYTSFKRLN